MTEGERGKARKGRRRGWRGGRTEDGGGGRDGR